MIIPQRITDIARLVESQGLDDKMISRLRGIYQGMHFTYCMDDDINEGEPVWQGARFNIYLVDSRNHCLRLTTNPEVASGVVLAEVIAESAQ